MVLANPSARSRNDGIEIRGMVDVTTWQRIREQDIFGARSRTRQTGPLPDDTDLRLSVFTSHDLPDDVERLMAEDFVITDAMHQVDPADVAAAGLEGEVWEGVAFTDPKPWSLAVDVLADLGFVPYDGLPSATTVRRASDDISVEFRRNEVAAVTQAQAVMALPMGDDVALATFQLINGINAAVPFSTTMIDAGDLIVRESIADQVGDAGPTLIAARVGDLVDIIVAISGPILEVARDEMTVPEALEAIFG